MLQEQAQVLRDRGKLFKLHSLVLFLDALCVLSFHADARQTQRREWGRLSVVTLPFGELVTLGTSLLFSSLVQAILLVSKGGAHRVYEFAALSHQVTFGHEVHKVGEDCAWVRCKHFE